MEVQSIGETFDTGLRNIRHEIKSRLVAHGHFGTVTNADSGAEQNLCSSTIVIIVQGRTAERTFSHQQIADCHLRVGGAVLDGILSMVEQLRQG